jgi:peptidoglycan/LPS O-acetylase OafA/YrhL
LKINAASAPGRSGYILGIEGLRGVAVIAVIINHLNKEYLPGGYLGVDVFFVISGFVISDLLSKLKFESRYEYFLIFYTRRIRRLFPALFVFVVLTTALSGYFFDGFGTHVVRTGGTALLGVSNLYLIRIGSDYFGLNSVFNIFTHTWSLGVEEQFYLIFPLLLFIFKKKNLNSVAYLILIASMSFLAFVVFSYYGKINLQYYLPVARFWEIFLGAITYVITKDSSLKKDTRDNKWHMHVYAISLLGCFSIPSSFFVFSAPVVCAITALILHSVRIHGCDYLETRFLLFTGKISYSLYLYHFPILVIFRFEPSLASISAQFIFLYVISFLSFMFVEKPFRVEQADKASSRAIYVFAITSISVALLIYVISKNIDTKDPFSPPVFTEKGFQSCSWSDIDDSKCLLRSDQKRQLFFVGDSHSNALLPMMVKLNEKLNYQVYSVGVGGLYTTKFTSSNHGDLSDKGEKVSRFIESRGKRGDVVILTNQLMTWFSRTYDDKQEDHRLFLNGTQLAKDQALKIHAHDIDRWAKKLDNIGISLIILAPFPDFKNHPSACYSPMMKFFRNLKFTTAKCQTTRSDQVARRGHILKVLKNLSGGNENVYLFDPIDLICSDNSCSSIRKGVPIYYDDDHVNHNMSRYMYPKFKDILDLL